jgi:adenylyltransferase/sulfurtransferase
MTSIVQITVQELQQLRARGECVVVLDVREPWEVEIAALPDCRHIPLNEIPLRLKELDADSAIIVMCKLGGRSQRAAEFLVNQGFTRVSNLQGGIDAGGREIDSKLPTY